ncbi:hypothetical protein HDU93_009184, partial [Gonapodya sp. JEL0774]
MAAGDARGSVPRDESDYTVGWICALDKELTAAQVLLDEEHEPLPYEDDGDDNVYTFGRMGEHNVVIACLPAGMMGTNSAAGVATKMKMKFRSLRFGLMVGIGGGVPSEEADIRLGDIVVSQPDHGHGGVVQYDFGKATPSGFERTGFLNAPPQILLNALSKLKANLLRKKSHLADHILKFNELEEFTRATAGPDVLFEATYNHAGGPTCKSCSVDKQVDRDARSGNAPVVHYGTIASGNQVLRNGAERDAISKEFGGVMCFEMEAAGLMNNFPCLVIRGICDYSDSHKNKKWQNYAAAVAAAYAKELLSVIPPTDVAKERTLHEATPSKPLKPVSKFYIPFLRNSHFVGRAKLLKDLEDALFVGNKCNKLAVVGLGGIGKTQIALELAYRVKDTHREYSIFWLPAISKAVFEQACGKVAEELGIAPADGQKEDVKTIVQQHLSGGKSGAWFLIVDNADDMDCMTDITPFLPQSENGRTLFTTRFQQVAVELAENDVFDLQEMDIQDAVDLFQSSLIRKELSSTDPSVTQDLLKELAYLPLAIKQAAAYLNINKTITVAKYLKMLSSTEKSMTKLLSEGFRDETRYGGSKHAVATTWMVSFEQIQKNQSHAADLLSFIACIESKSIPRSILPVCGDELDMESAISALVGYSFLSARGSVPSQGPFDMHRLVHLAAGTWLRTHEDLWAKETAEVIMHFSQIFPTDEWDNRFLWRDYLPHVLKVLEYEGSEATTEKLVERYNLCLRVGCCLIKDGRGTEAIPVLEECVKGLAPGATSGTTPDKDASFLNARYALALACLSGGQASRAVQELEQIVDLGTKISAKSDPKEVLEWQLQLARAYLACGRKDDGIKMLLRVRDSAPDNNPLKLLAADEAISIGSYGRDWVDSASIVGIVNSTDGDLNFQGKMIGTVGARVLADLLQQNAAGKVVKLNLF